MSASSEDNYTKAARQAERLFVGYDQDKVIEKFCLRHDDDSIYIGFLKGRYAVSRRTGEIFRLGKGADVADIREPASYAEALTILDLLCHNLDSKPKRDGGYAVVNGINHLPKTIGVDPFSTRNTASLFDRFPDAFEAACRALGGTRVQAGDIGYKIPLFDLSGSDYMCELVEFLSVIVRFYRSDDEFCAQATTLWDKEILLMMKYETLFIAESWLYSRIASLMPSEKPKDELSMIGAYSIKTS